MIVKFRDDTRVTASRNDLVFRGTGAHVRVQALLAKANAEHVSPVFTAAESKLDAQRDQLEAKGKDVPDFTSYFSIKLKSGESGQALVDKLKRDPLVDTAYVPGVDMVASLPEDLRSFQGPYWSSPTSTTQGLGITGATGLGVKGKNVSVADIEYGLNDSHEDLQPSKFVRLTSNAAGAAWPEINHGTATASVINARQDGIGIDGIVPEASYQFHSKELGIANAIQQTAAGLLPGDVLLIELSTGPSSSIQYPVEVQDAEHAAISAAVASGIIVVEPAGNTNMDLNSTASSNDFQYTRDSGAIIVGAGAPPAGSCPGATQTGRTRLSFSNYGARVDVQAPGDCVPSAGYGNLSSYETGDNNSYGWFNGTSSASAVTAGVVAALSSQYEEATGLPLSPEGARSALKRTGLAQVTAGAPYAGAIGPQVNLTAALQYLTDAPDTTIPSGPTAGSITSNPRPTYTFSSPTAGVTFECRFYPLGLQDPATLPPFAPCSGSGTHTPTTDVPDGNNRFEVRAVRNVGGVNVADVTPATRKLGVLSTTSGATAGTVSLSGTTLTVAETAGAPRRNDIVITPVGTNVMIQDTFNRALRSATGTCTQLLIDLVRCPAASVSQINVNAGALEDRITSAVNIATVLHGGSGNDTLRASGTAADSLYGDDGTNDTLDYAWSTTGVTVSYDATANDGPAGNDNVGNDFEQIYGTDANDTINVVSSVAYPAGTAPQTTLYGYGGDDALTSGQGGAFLVPGNGNDTVTSNAAVTAIDYLWYNERTDNMNINLGSGASGTDTAAGNDTLGGGSFEFVYMGSGNDTITDTATNEQLIDAGGNDLFVMTGGGNDLVYTGGGDDRVTEGPGNDEYFGGQGNDTFTASATGGSDRYHGEDDIDTVIYQFFTTAVTVTTDGATNDGTVGGSGQYDNVDADVENISTGAGADTINTSTRSVGGTLRGYGANDTITGGSGNDTLMGGTGTDNLFGGDGDDRLEARDTLTSETVNCGNGADTALADTGDILTSCETILP